MLVRHLWRPIAGKIRHSQFVRNTFWYTALTGFERAFALAQTVLIARALGITEYGVYGLLLGTIGLVASGIGLQIEHFAGLFEVIGCLTDEAEKAAMRVRLKAALQRAYRPAGTARQLLAVLADPDRSAEVAQINCPTTLIHGEDDPLVRIAAMEHMQRLLPEATAHRIPGLGHYMPEWVVPTLVEQVTEHLRRS